MQSYSFKQLHVLCLFAMNYNLILTQFSYKLFYVRALGPSILDLQLLYIRSVDEIAWIHTTFGMGAIVGAMMAGEIKCFYLFVHYVRVLRL